MTGKLLLRGMIAGAAAALLAFFFARLVGEPLVDAAIAFEDHANSEAGLMAEPELVSRATQAGIGLLTGILAFGIAIGGLTALVFSLAYGRFSRLTPRPLSLVIAAAGFIAVVVVPMLKYPPNPPAVGSAETIGVRTELYFILLAAAIAALVGAIALARRLAPRFDGFSAGVLATVAYVAVMALVILALPAINEVPETFSAVVLWRFRIASLGLEAIIWGVSGLVFGYLANHLLTPAIRRRPAAA